MVKPFLASIAETYFQEYGNQLQRLRFVFPNRRAGVFFQKYLAQLIDTPIILPEITTINEWVAQLTNLEKADPLDLLFELYQVYLSTTGREETFDEFYHWGNILISDFDEIDKYLVDAEKLYGNIVALKEIDVNFAGLEEDQVEAIRAFWNNFENDDTIKAAFLKNWKTIYPVYKNFRQQLEKQQRGYDGYIYRSLAESFQNETFHYNDDKITVFAGFNALNKCEEQLFEYFKKHYQAEFCWDITLSPFMNETNNAVRFMLKYSVLFPQKSTLKLEYTPKVDLTSIAVPSVSGQAYLCHDRVKSMMLEKDADLTQKVLILNDESLLPNILYSIPTDLPALNITMGYPLKGSTSLSLINLLVKLVKNSRKGAAGMSFYSRDVIHLIQHQWVKRFSDDTVCSAISAAITQQNLIYWSPDGDFESPLLRLIFSMPETSTALPEYILNVLDYLLDAWDEEDEKGLQAIEKESLFFLSGILSKLTVKLEQTVTPFNFDTASRIIHRATQGQSIPFEGEPLHGLQLMGVLESRTIDFDEIVFISFNERIFPRRSPDNTFIPYNLRKGYGLTTVEYHDAMHAYYFYRLLQRASKVTMVYNTSQSGIYPAEPSRYLLQLKYLYPVKLKEHAVSFEPNLGTEHSIRIEASAETKKLLQKFVGKEEKYLSPSALNTFIDCSLRFYFSYLKDLKEEEEIEEEIDARVFGSIYHEAIENLYMPYENQMITRQILDELKKSPKIDHEIKVSMAHNYFKCPVEKVEIKGQFQIIFSVLKKYILQTLEVDKGFAPFVYKKGEEELRAPFGLNEGFAVNLGGKIDRIDEVKNTVRIIDYKTGQADKGDMGFSTIEELFTASEKRSKYVFQTLFYLMLYRQHHPETKTSAGIYFLRNLFNESFLWEVLHKTKSYQNISDFTPFVDEFEEKLMVLLENLFAGNTDFTQTEVLKNCSYCPYKTVCMR